MSASTARPSNDGSHQGEGPSALSGFKRLPPELRNLVYAAMCAANEEPSVIVLVPNPFPARMPVSMQPSPRRAVWRMPHDGRRRPFAFAGLREALWHWHPDDLKPPTQSRVPAQLPPRLYLLCHELYRFALPLFYGSVVFGFWNVAGLDDFFARIPPLACSGIRHLVVDVAFGTPESSSSSSGKERAPPWESLDVAEDIDLDGAAAMQVAIMDAFEPWQRIWTRAGPRLTSLEHFHVSLSVYSYHVLDDIFPQDLVNAIFEAAIAPLGAVKAKHCTIHSSIKHKSAIAHSQALVLENHVPSKRMEKIIMGLDESDDFSSEHFVTEALEAIRL